MALNLSPLGIALLGLSAVILATRPLRATHYLLPLKLLVHTSLVVEVVGLLLASYGKHNIWLYNLYLPWEFLLVLLIVLPGAPSRMRKPVLVIALLAYGAACAYDLRSRSDGALGELSAVSMLVSVVVLVPLLFIVLVRTANTPERSLLSIPDVWLLLALMVYFGGIVPCIAFFNHFLERSNYAAIDRVITVVQVLFVLRSAFTAVACWKLRDVPVPPAAMNGR